MKLCTNCLHYKRHGTVNNGRGMVIELCLHPELPNPVDGTPLPCGIVREKENLCGISGKGFINAPQDSPTAPTSEKSRILTAT